MNQPIKRQFSGRWITTEEFCNVQINNMFHRQLDPAPQKSFDLRLQNRHILFRRKFQLDRVGETLLHITADDYYKLYLNGKFVTQGPAAGYTSHYFYNTVDITGFLHPGENTVAIHTYYQGLINRVWVSGDNRHGLLLDMVSDGKTILASDESFLRHLHTGFSALEKVGYETQYMERYDCNAPEVNFERPEFDDTNWSPAKINPNADYTLYPQPSRQLVFEEIAPVAMRCEGKHCFIDFGAMYVGALKFTATGAKDTEITMHFGQELNEDGSVRYRLRANCVYVESMKLSGAADTLNQFDYKSFRYVELFLPEHADCLIDPNPVVLTARHYPFELKARCNRSDSKSRMIWDLCVRTLQYGVQEEIQDCMEREKGYYLGDGCYSLLTYSLLTRDYSLMEKFFDDFLRTAFINRGLMTCGACSFMQEIAEYPFIMLMMLLEYCHLTGNHDFIKARYPAFTDILDFYREEYATANGLLNNLDKWCVVEWPQNMRDGYDVDLTEGQVCVTMHNVINAYYIGAIKCVNKIARIIGEPDYADVAPLQEAFVETFYDRERKLFKDSASSNHISLPGNVFAWLFELFPEEEARRNTIAMIREKRLSQSLFFETFPMFCALVRDGEEKLMHDLLTDDRAWLNIIAEGGTATFEGWAKDLKWNTSLFHLTLAYGAAFLTDWNIAEIFDFGGARP